MKRDRNFLSATKRLPPAFCPYCFTLLDAATNMESVEPPRPGDYTVCIECCGVLTFGDDMSIKAASLMDLPTHDRMRFAQMVSLCKQYRATRPPRKPSSAT